MISTDECSLKNFFENPVPYLALFNSFLVTYFILKGYYLNRQKIKLELYDRRFKVFEAIQELITAASNNKKTISPEKLNEFGHEIKQATFLFGSEIEDFLFKLSVDYIKLYHKQEELEKMHPSSEKNQLCEEFLKEYDSFEFKLKDSKELFGKYLNFENLK